MPDLRALFHGLIRLETEVGNAVDAKLRAEHGLALSRFEPMQVIASQPKCRVHDIAATLSLTTGGTSKLVDGLEASGYCRRLPNPDDRRSSLLELTPQGKRVLAKATKTLDRELARRMGGVLPDRSVRQFTSMLAKLRASQAAS